MKTCTRCQKMRPLTEFLTRGDKRGLRSECRSCTLEANKVRRPRYREQEKAANSQWHQENRAASAARHTRNRDAKPAQYRRAHLGRKFGITLEQHDAMLAQQDSRCAICYSGFGQTPHVDHDHQTGAIRGLLCSKCNTMLGMAKDSPDVLRAAADYLEKHNALRLVAA